jgi:hypothetical protein
MKLLSVISEIATDLSKVYPFSKLEKSFDPGERDKTIYNFETESGKLYKVSFFPISNRFYPDGTYVREYAPYDMLGWQGTGIDDKSLTGENKALKVNATVMAITIDWLNNNKDLNTFYQLLIKPVDKRRYKLVMMFINNHIAGQYDITHDSSLGETIIIRNIGAKPRYFDMGTRMWTR